MRNQVYNFSGHQFSIKNYDRVATDLYVDQPLTNLSIKYTNRDFIADVCVPRIPVTQETGKIWSYGLENFLYADLRRGDKSKSKRTSYSVSSSTTYDLTTYALSDMVTQSMMTMAAGGMNPEADTTEFLTDILALNKEYLLGSALFNTASTGFSGYTETLNSGSARYQWNDYTNSNPIQDVEYAKFTKIAKNSGATSGFNVIMGQEVWEKLTNHPDLLDNIKYTQTGIILPDLAAKLFQVDNVYVGRAVYNSSNEPQTASLSFVWGKYVLVYHKGQPSLKTAACASIIHGGNVVRKWTDNEYRGATVIEVEEALQPKILSARSGYLFSTAVA